MAAARAYVDHLAAVGYAGIHLDGGDLMWLYGAPWKAGSTAKPIALADRRSACGEPTTTLGAGYGSPLCQYVATRAVLGWRVAGPGSDWSEVSMSGCESATLD